MDYTIDSLRKKAKDILRSKSKEDITDVIENIEKLLEDYNIHKIELELQHDELLRTNQVLEKQNQKLEQLFDHAPIGYLILDHDGYILEVNQTGKSILQKDKKTLHRTPFHQYIHPGSQDRFYFHWLALKETGEAQSIDIRLKRENQEVKHFLINSLLYKDSETGKKLVRVSLTDISAVKEAEALRDSERRYRMLFQNMINGLLVLKPYVVENELMDFRFFRANSVFQQLTGTSTQSMDSVPFMHIFPDEGFQILPMLFSTFSENKNQKLENIQLKSGNVVNIYSYIPEKDYVALIFENVTGQKLAEADRLKSDQMLKTVFKILPVGVTITNKQGKIIDLNKASEQMLGIHVKDHIFKDIPRNKWKVVRKDLTPLPQSEYASVLALQKNKIVENVEMGVIKSDGSITWLNVSAAPVPLPDLGVAVVYSDITQRVKAQEETEEKFKNIVQNSTDAIIIVNPKGSIIEWNKGCEIIFDTSRKDAIGQKLWLFLQNVLSPDSPLKKQSETLRRKIKQALVGGKSEWFKNLSEVDIIDKQGNVKTIQSVIFPVRSSYGYLLGLVARDITETKQTEIMLKIAKQKAEEASQAKSLFLANISHEIRTPINAIMGFTEILKEYPLSDVKFKSHLKGIEKSSKALISLINDILDLSRIEAGKMILNPTNFNIRDLIYDVKQIFSLKASEKGIEIITNVSEYVPQWLVMDETRIRQILFNLVGNAVKFTHRGGISIDISCNINFENKNLIDLHMEVADTGIGIDQRNLKTIFEPFYQKNPPGFLKQEGTGLGLSISKRFVEMMNGEISVESEMNRGTRFMIKIPGISVVRDHHSSSKKSPENTFTSENHRDETFAPFDNIQLIRKIFDEVIIQKGSEENAKVFMQEKIWFEFDKISDILGFDEIFSFAKDLIQLSDEHNLINLKLFAQKLQEQAKGYNVIEINRLLSAFESLRQ